MDDAALATMRTSLYRNNYKQYKRDKDFEVWLEGLRFSVASSMRDDASDDDINKEVLRLLPSKLDEGVELQAFMRIAADNRKIYATVVKQLKGEFLDENDEMRFENNMDFVKRKKKQEIKDFATAVQSSVKKCRLTSLAGEEKERDNEREGVKRFIAGIRDRKGKKRKDLVKTLKFNMKKESEMTWENAKDFAQRWEAVNDAPSSESSSSSSSSSFDSSIDSEDDKKKKKKKKPKSKKKDKKKDSSDDESEDDKKKESKKSKTKKGKKDAATVATLADRVHSNMIDIKSLKTDTETLSHQFNKLAQENSFKFDTMMSKMDNMVTGSQLTAATQQLSAAVQRATQPAAPTYRGFQPNRNNNVNKSFSNNNNSNNVASVDEDMIGAMGGEGAIYMDFPTYFQLNQQAGVSDAGILAQLNSQMQNLG